jgi:hypothetical protein
MYGTNEERESGVNICRVATSNSCQVSIRPRGLEISAHLSRRDVFWRTIFQQPNASFGEDIEVMFDLVICRTPKHIGQKGHCLTISFNTNNDRAGLP